MSHQAFFQSSYCHGEYLHPRSRQEILKIVETEQIPWSLVLNYDQTWCNGFRAPVRNMARKKRKRGQANCVRIGMITGSRAGMSFCTSSWGDGTPGPLFISIGQNAMSVSWPTGRNSWKIMYTCRVDGAVGWETAIVGFVLIYCMAVCQCFVATEDKMVDKLNAEGKGMFMVHKNADTTHFMHGESTIRMFRTLISDSYDMRRSALNMHGRRGLLLADAFTGNSSKKGGRMFQYVLLHLQGSAQIAMTDCSFYNTVV